MFESVIPAERRPVSVVGSRWLWAARCSALIYTIFLVAECLVEALSEPAPALLILLFTYGARVLLALVLLYFLFRGEIKSLAFALGLGAATAFIALFGVASNALFWPIGRSFNLFLALVIFSPVTPPFVAMMHQPDPHLAAVGLSLFWSFGICSAVLGAASVATFRNISLEANAVGALRFAFRAGIFCPLAVWLVFALLILIWIATGGGIHI
ncbi:MAG TPA: hypothetical protein VMJ93_10410 [Verrucomicrobiae bacterium]|nr:hypothetical protein [Verrucomicrobiae bacterium]